MTRRSDEERAIAQWEREVRRALREGREPPPRPDPTAAGTGLPPSEPLGTPPVEPPGTPPSEPPGTPSPAPLGTPSPWPAEEDVARDPLAGEGATVAWSAEDDRHAQEWTLEQGVRSAADWASSEAPGAAAAADEPSAPIHRGLPHRRRHAPDAAPEGWGAVGHRAPASVPEGAGGPRGRRGLTVGRLAAIVALVLMLASGFFLFELFQPFHGAGKGSVVVSVPEGASARDIGDLLQKRGVVSSSFFFSLRATLAGDRSKLGTGTFHLARDMSYGDALKALTRTPGPPPTLSVALPEGLWASEIAARAKTAGVRGSYLSAARSSPGFDPASYGAGKPRSLEGFLFPATYKLRVPASARALVAQQLALFRRNVAKVDMSYPRARHLSVYDVIVIASMIEGEAATKGDRPKVAAVIYNRLRAGIALGLDATMRYALHDRTHPLTVSQLQSTSPWNPRLRKGLPPGPIGNPGLAALEAAAHPARADYLYFVVKPGRCGMVFTSSYATFQRDQARYTAALRRLGHSPSTC